MPDVSVDDQVRNFAFVESLLISFASGCVFLVSLFVRNWWGLIAPESGSGGRFHFSLTMNTYGINLLFVFIFSFLILWLLSGIFSRWSFAGKTGPLICGFVFFTSVSFFSYSLYRVFLENSDLRSPQGSLGYIDPSKLYLLVTALSMVTTTFVCVLFVIVKVLFRFRRKK